MVCELNSKNKAQVSITFFVLSSCLRFLERLEVSRSLSEELLETKPQRKQTVNILLKVIRSQGITSK